MKMKKKSFFHFLAGEREDFNVGNWQETNNNADY
jgi:hypothetical protein